MADHLQAFLKAMGEGGSAAPPPSPGKGTLDIPVLDLDAVWPDIADALRHIARDAESDAEMSACLRALADAVSLWQGNALGSILGVAGLAVAMGPEEVQCLSRYLATWLAGHFGLCRATIARAAELAAIERRRARDEAASPPEPPASP